MITYPATYPLPDEFRTRKNAIDFNQAVFEGQFSRQTQVQQHSGGKSDRWTGVWSTTNILAADIAKVEAFLASLKGHIGTFYAYDPDRRIATGSDASTALFAGDSTTFAGDSTTFAGSGVAPFVATVDGAGQSGTSLAVTFQATSTQVMTVGDYFQVGVGFHMLTVDPVTDGSGDVTLEFEPALRISPNDGQLVFTVNPVMIARLDEQYKGGDTGSAKSGVVAFSFHEDVQ